MTALTTLCLQVENFGALRYERSHEVAAHGRVLTQRHEATNIEVDMAEGTRRLVSTFQSAGPMRRVCSICVS